MCAWMVIDQDTTGIRFGWPSLPGNEKGLDSPDVIVRNDIKLSQYFTTGGAYRKWQFPMSAMTLNYDDSHPK